MAKSSSEASISPPETARYTGDLLESLQKIARKQGQDLLAHLLALAVLEAKTLADSGAAHAPTQHQDTRLPG
jgi:hypothetical protein